MLPRGPVEQQKANIAEKGAECPVGVSVASPLGPISQPSTLAFDTQPSTFDQGPARRLAVDLLGQGL